jgi:hypothetical protein
MNLDARKAAMTANWQHLGYEPNETVTIDATAFRQVMQLMSEFADSETETRHPLEVVELKDHEGNPTGQHGIQMGQAVMSISDRGAALSSFLEYFIEVLVDDAVAGKAKNISDIQRSNLEVSKPTIETTKK